MIFLIWRLASSPASEPFVALPGSREPAPPLRFERHDGTGGALSDLPGPVLLHFWASWCSPCRDELPELLELARTPGLPFRVLAVAVDDTWPAMRQLPGLAAHLVVRATHRADVDAFGISALPVTLLLDADHRRLERYEGPRAWTRPSVRDHLARALASPPAPPD